MKNFLQYASPKIFKTVCLAMAAMFTISIMTACSKEQAGADINLSYQMLADKTWYLEYAQTTTSAGTSTRTYVGQSTYFINFLKDLSTIDSDGLNGTYTVENNNNQLQIHVQAKTSNGNAIEYVYNIESMGAKHLVMYSSVNSVKTTYYYNTQK